MCEPDGYRGKGRCWWIERRRERVDGRKKMDSEEDGTRESAIGALGLNMKCKTYKRYRCPPLGISEGTSPQPRLPDRVPACHRVRPRHLPPNMAASICHRHAKMAPPQSSFSTDTGDDRKMIIKPKNSFTKVIGKTPIDMFNNK